MMHHLAPGIALGNPRRQRGGLVVSPLRRLLVFPLLLLTLLAGLGPFVDSGAYSSPVFETFRSLAPMSVWGVAFVLVSFVHAASALTGRLGLYLASLASTGFLCGFWFLVLLKSRAIDGIPVSLPAFGLWACPIGICLVLLAVPISTVDR